ncbi:MAG TPA: response regulator [Polyangiales bacterium]|nr:response regulator [Polyangiales bacterium]
MARIAVIDDDDDIRDVFERRLRGAGYEVVAYDRADQALHELEYIGSIDLILFDLRMPGMTGWSFRIEQKSRTKLRDVPVIALSADASPYARAIDADAYLAKPVDLDELEAAIGRVLLASERRRLLAKSLELERIHALGTLVASVAHEINNPLTYIIGCLELASNQARELATLVSGNPLTSTLPQNLDFAKDGAARIASVVKLLSTFSRADTTSSDDVDVVRAVQAATRLVRHHIAANAHLREELEPTPRVRGNEGRLAQVVLNLVMNAAQAVASSASSHGLVRVATRFADGTVAIEVSDTGPGIHPALLDKIFEAFFTTKPAGMGTGLGLSISRDIVRAMGGTLTVRSELGQGATFIVTLPAAPTGMQTREPGGSNVAESSGPVCRILVIDDEPLIGRVVRSVLSRHAVDVSLSPREALQLVNTRDYDLILCDFRMPEMTGLELYQQLHPKQRSMFVLMTGSRDHAEIQEFAQRKPTCVLYKPFSRAELDYYVSHIETRQQVHGPNDVPG